jgi:hypothetical protein
MATGSTAGPNQAIGPGGATRTISERVARRVWVAAGGRCTMCNRYLLEDEFTGRDVAIGELAHIVGWTDTPGSPRGDEPLELDERNTEANLMLLCRDQHRVIDTRSLWEVYDAETLRGIKRSHEHRIRQLTALRRDDRSTVLRVVGSLHDAPVHLGRASIATALLADRRFPDYALTGADEFEIDLRGLPGEANGQPTYWAMATELIRERVASLSVHVAQENVNRIAVFPFARVPALIALGAELDDCVPTDIYPRRRDAGEGWGWTPGAPVVRFTWSCLQEGSDSASVAVVFSVSGTPDRGRLPEWAASATLYEVRPEESAPGPELISNPVSLDLFAQTWRGLLAELERRHPRLEAIGVFAAVPAVAAVVIGRSLMRAVHPRLWVFDRGRDDEEYQFALEVAP